MTSRILGLLALGMLSSAAHAEVITLDFEGLSNLSPVGNFYDGGGGTNYGISFSNATLALIDEDAGGTGNFANEPSPNTVMFFLDADNAVLDFAAGFDTGFSFYYSSSTEASVTIWSEVGGSGTLLGTLNLLAQGAENCTGDPNGYYCNWTAVGATFDGIARSINFGGTANYTGYDNITFGSEIPGGGTEVPEPASLALLGLGLAGLGLGRRRKV